MKKTLLFLAVGAALFSSPRAFAVNADSGLYDPVPPPDSAFVRFLGAWETSGSKEARVNSKPLEYVDFQELSSYFVASKGPVTITVGDAQERATIEEGKYYTVVLENSRNLKIVEDKQSDNLAKSQIMFYNLNPGNTLSLKTSDGTVEVVSPTPAGEVGERQINPVKVSLAIYDGDRVLRDLGPLAMERGRSYSVIAYPNNDVKVATSTTNTTR